jgi:hypothetical protein
VQHLDKPCILKPAPGSVQVRSPSGHLVGILDPKTLILEVKRGGRPAEQIDLKPLIKGDA